MPNKQPIYLGLKAGKNYGWGVCSEYLINELSRISNVCVLDEKDGTADNPQLPGSLFQALTNVNFFPLFPKACGNKNFGYTFFENELTKYSLENAKKYDLVIGGSSWCKDRLIEKGINSCDVLIQGIDPDRFYPIEEEKTSDNFVIFSGGKFELRKGQDIVLKATKILQEKYDDIILVNCWLNLWPQSIQLMRYSPHIRLDGKPDGRWLEFMHHIYTANGLDPKGIKTFELVPNELLREIYRHTDIGVFPNRCEGGTNLVLMEYMACGKPVIASNASGHKDIVTDKNALLLNDLRKICLYDQNKNLIGRWQEPSLDEIVECIEYAYHHRDEVRKIGKRAGKDLEAFTWRKSAENLLSLIER